jgi:hypothetical protein
LATSDSLTKDVDDAVQSKINPANPKLHFVSNSKTPPTPDQTPRKKTNLLSLADAAAKEPKGTLNCRAASVAGHTWMIALGNSK